MFQIRFKILFLHFIFVFNKHLFWYIEGEATFIFLGLPKPKTLNGLKILFFPLAFYMVWLKPGVQLEEEDK